MYEINYPEVALHIGEDISDKEVRYWIHRVNELKKNLSKIFHSVISIESNLEKTLGFIAPILDRQIELSDSIFILMTKGRVRDSGILLLTLYELVLDIQYVSIHPGFEKIWMEHNKLHTKPWRVADQIQTIFKEGSDGEKEMYKHYSSIKHGNYAANEFSFNLMVKDKKIKLAELKVGFLMPNLQALTYLLNRTATATFSMLKDIDCDFSELQKEWEHTYNKLHNDLLKLLQIMVLDIQYRDDQKKKRELFEKLNLSFEF